VGALLGMAISPAARDPWLVAVYAALAGAMGVCSLLFWWFFRKYDRIDDQLNRIIDGTLEKQGAQGEQKTQGAQGGPTEREG
jgi:POT family proton-dependent oligopeptide transporter